ncbi:MAG: acylphosphatase [Sarcina sp.]
MRRESFIVKGKVQGVGFRFFVKLNAMKLSLTGFAKNLTNGDVLVEIQGSLDNINKLKKLLFKGNGFCKVTSISDEKSIQVINENIFNMY